MTVTAPQNPENAAVAWAPPTTGVAEPRNFPAAAWDTSQLAAAITVLDRP